MKKVLKIILIAVAAAVIIGGITAYALLPHPLSYDIKGVPGLGSTLTVTEEKPDEVTVKAAKDNFKVLMFTDMHLDGKNKTSNITVTHLVNNILSEKPDLVILGGDNVTSALNRKRAHQLAEIFEKLGVYWAGGLGNHEGDNGFSISREEMVKIFSSYEHCLIRKGVDGLFGVGNYALTVLNPDDTVKHVYYFLDTGDEMSTEDKITYNIPEDKSPYDGAKPSQIAWFTAKNNSLKEQYGKFNATLVVHIPLPQYADAYETGTPEYGEKLEKICASGFDAGLFDALKKSGTVHNVFCGHDHLNTFGIEYDGIMLSYIQPSGYGSYTAQSRLGYEEKDWLQGCTAIDMIKDGTFTMRRIRNSEK